MDLHARTDRKSQRKLEICRSACILRTNIAHTPNNTAAIITADHGFLYQSAEDAVRRRCGWIAPVTSYPGEFEQEALASGALRVLTGQESALTYPGRPV